MVQRAEKKSTGACVYRLRACSLDWMLSGRRMEKDVAPAMAPKVVVIVQW